MGLDGGARPALKVGGLGPLAATPGRAVLILKLMSSTTLRSAIMARLESLPPEQLAEVAQFIAFVSERDAEQWLRDANSRASEPSFGEVWDNDDDSIYDRA